MESDSQCLVSFHTVPSVEIPITSMPAPPDYPDTPAEISRADHPLANSTGTGNRKFMQRWMIFLLLLLILSFILFDQTTKIDIKEPSRKIEAASVTLDKIMQMLMTNPRIIGSETIEHRNDSKSESRSLPHAQTETRTQSDSNTIST